MYRHLFTVLAALAAALLLVPAALALRVHVRVEGKTRTIFGATEPTLSVQLNPLDALEAASIAGEFYYHVTQTSSGPYVDQIGRYPANGSSGWVFKVNGVLSPVGATAVTLHNGDRVLWYWASFAGPRSPSTLVLRRTRRNCYRVLAQDDSGKTHAARGALLHVGSRAVHAASGSACVGKHQGLVRATLAGDVRSNELP